MQFPSAGPRVSWLQKRYFAVLLVLVFGCAFQAFAQEATIVGTVTDPSGAAVANAKITVTRAETGLAQTIATSDNGEYVVLLEDDARAKILMYRWTP